MDFAILLRIAKYLLWMILAAGPLFELLRRIGKLASDSLGSIATGMADLAALAQQYMGAINVSGIGAHIGQANRMFPFTEVLTIMGSYAIVKVLVFTVRTIKAWIPTLS